jgi:hypothetical protein
MNSYAHRRPGYETLVRSILENVTDDSSKVTSRGDETARVVVVASVDKTVGCFFRHQTASEFLLNGSKRGVAPVFVSHEFLAQRRAALADTPVAPLLPSLDQDSAVFIPDQKPKHADSSFGEFSRFRHRRVLVHFVCHQTGLAARNLPRQLRQRFRVVRSGRERRGGRRRARATTPRASPGSRRSRTPRPPAARPKAPRSEFWRASTS